MGIALDMLVGSESCGVSGCGSLRAAGVQSLSQDTLAAVWVCIAAGRGRVANV